LASKIKRKVAAAKKRKLHKKILDRLEVRLLAYEAVVQQLSGQLETILRLLQDPVERTNRRMALKD